jgi:hypothetical protein
MNVKIFSTKKKRTNVKIIRIGIIALILCIKYLQVIVHFSSYWCMPSIGTNPFFEEELYWHPPIKMSSSNAISPFFEVANCPAIPAKKRNEKKTP